MTPGQFIVVWALLGIGVAASAGLFATRLRVVGGELQQRALAQDRSLPPLVEAYFRWSSRALAGFAGAFLAVAVGDGLAARFMEQAMVSRVLGFVAAVLLLACAGMQLLTGTVDMRLRLAPQWQRILLMVAGVVGTTLAAAAMVQLVQRGSLWK